MPSGVHDDCEDAVTPRAEDTVLNPRERGTGMAAHAQEGRPDRIVIENVNHPGCTTTVDGAKYRAAREALLTVLPTAAPGLTQGELQEALLPLLPERLFPGGATAGWWAKAVQLDLEAKGIQTFPSH